MEKTSRFQQMTRPTQKTGDRERRGTGRTKAEKEGGREREVGGYGWRGGTQPKKGYEKREEEKIAEKV